jgi:DNA-binding transcriptional LysR family regulator
VDPHLLRTFIAVTDSGSFSAAASRLGYTQSAVSQQIALLEADLGTALLHRRPVSVTEAGERLLEHAGPILMRLDAAPGITGVALSWPPLVHRTELVRGSSAGPAASAAADAMARV